jgi:hypothetical protein
MKKIKLFNQLKRITFGTQGRLTGRWTHHSYGVTGTWSAGYGVADVPVACDVLSATGLPVEILINTHICYMFSYINEHVLYILVKTLFSSRRTTATCSRVARSNRSLFVVGRSFARLSASAPLGTVGWGWGWRRHELIAALVPVAFCF